jgi:hypothetical protein
VKQSNRVLSVSQKKKKKSNRVLSDVDTSRLYTWFRSWMWVIILVSQSSQKSVDVRGDYTRRQDAAGACMVSELLLAPA